MTSLEPAGGALGYAGIAERLRARIARGELKGGDRLPSVREAARELRVNVNTVARAYAELAREGVLVTQAGGGTHVAARPDGPLFVQARESRLRELVGQTVLQALGLGYQPAQIEAAVISELARWQAADWQPMAPEDRVDSSLIFAGSHDLTLDLLAARLQRASPPITLSASYGGSLAGLIDLARGEAHLAGCHLLDEESGDYNAPFVARLLPGQRVLLVTLALREQGLFVRAGNPRAIRVPVDLVRPDIVVAPRQAGSGTQVLLEHALRAAGLDPHQPRTNGRVYGTHLAVAGAVAEGGADVGLGIRAAARAYGLDFVPLATERYELAIPGHLAEQAAVQAVLAILADDDFTTTVRELGGYDVSETGRQRWIGYAAEGI